MRFIYNINSEVAICFKSIQRSEVGVVLVHGLNSTPFEMNHIAEKMAREGFSAHSIRIPGHASHPSDLLGVTWHEWVEATYKAVQEMRASCNKVYVVGQCAGGILGLYTSTLIQVDGVVLLAPVMKVSKTAQSLILLATAIGKQYRTWRPAVEDMEGVNWHGYYTQPISVHKNFVDLQSATWAKLPEISSPLLIIKSKQDGLITQDQVDGLLGLPRGKTVLIEIDGKAHFMALNEAVKYQVVDHILNYIKTQSTAIERYDISSHG